MVKITLLATRRSITSNLPLPPLPTPPFQHKKSAANSERMGMRAILLQPSSSITLSFNKTRAPSLPQTTHFFKPIKVKASSTSLDYPPPSSSTSPKVSTSTSKWQWKFKDNSVNIHYEEHKKSESKNQPTKEILMIPTISDVSTVEEWRQVAKDIVGRDGTLNYRATIVDWPGLGYSDRPKLDYTADVMEKFFVDLVNSPDGPLNSSNSDDDLVVFGGGHAATIAVRAATKGLVKPTAVAAIAPTWAGPLPIVFGRDSNMETRYGFLRGTLRAPAVGWMMYNVLVSNEKAIQSQYKSHVYADPENVTPSIVESRFALTKRNGARYVPAAFLTGLLDPVKSREEFIELFAKLGEEVPVLVVSTTGSPKRSKAEMEALRNAKGLTKFVELQGALLPQEEYPSLVAEELYRFLLEIFS